MIGAILLIVAVVAIVVLAIVLAYLQKKKMRAAFAALAAAHGWSFVEDDKRLPDSFARFRPFGQGNARRFDWLLSGRHEGIDIRIFQYHYETHSTDSRGNRQTQHHIFRGAMALMQVDAPDLRISPENIFHKIGDALGGEDIDFESDEFSRRFWVKCPDRQFAYAIIHPRMMEYMLPIKGWSWEWRGRTLMVYRSGALKPEACMGIVDMLVGFYRRVPRHVRAEASN